ncbi:MULTISPECIES: class I poly(R)-hydroxyalkanoic acid synthase [unclassified Rhizobium]|uniref:class I poly(R)-hydroxyalkanoic acid synthase n=1 Tax=unclassified Rhizobium TaxID=2613769 RepID=UPI001ADC0FDF|nr:MULTISPECIES: class I poly(R)-hydroxyalkanoic acid synthase [unclassified Rhizobium]MBO9098681.1 class I poly(R)-hydroxyalkanoic acid synthase [Rhizobium sp. L58/93]MBO9168947.1 class I poly(R)-hydroxyalkanoic acid synthase [Rhizobium sp. L245/93]MBO9184897.1 class I poly(R)-hydroxyalkanoic acid synthase [Rhizobium sp. E27B/91]MBO9132514.1 class I poly(R)-hydroxyalkanoic acid synthase [Rhizobium sp. B209b/85]QXZ85062.1 class I poly(R)-hydroxyalkanoic acid synthase [Rhizobium sp. K1/93]
MSDSKRDDSKGEPAKSAFDAASADPYIVKDPETMALNFARALQNLGKAASAWLAPRERGERIEGNDSMTDMVKTLSTVSDYWMSDPQRSFEAQTKLLSGYFGLWTQSMQRLSEPPSEPPPQAPIKDKRLSGDDWQSNPFFDFLRQTYLVTSDWADTLVTEAEGLDAHTRHKASFYVRQIMAAISPANFIATNPQLYRETVASNAENLVRGMKMLAEDIGAGGGDLKLRQTDLSHFAIGRNLAMTPGKVVAESELCQIVQYEPATETVFKRPLLICPPWINKFYILDLNPEKSFIKWCVDQGHTVFVISWVNPDARHAEKDWADYIHEGIDFALDAIEDATGETEVNAIGYCVGGTLLSSALALHAAEGIERVKSLTLLTSQVDFTHAGDLKVFVDEEQLQALERQMSLSGYLDGSKMATAFNMLRASELIWPYFVNNYLKGQEPLPFDLLYWNGDSTRMAAANHLFYLRNCYLDNTLSQGRMVIDGKTLSLNDVTIPVYNLATRDDHIAPAKSVYLGGSFFGGPVDFVVAGSGHIAGIVNPPERRKYQFWSEGPSGEDFDGWMAGARETAGSWWPHWQTWIETLDATRAAPRIPGSHSPVPLEPAPGSFVMQKT